MRPGPDGSLTQPPPPPSAPAPLAQEARHRLAGQVKEVEQEARQRLISIIEQRMEARNRANPFSLRDPFPDYSRGEDLERLKNLKLGGALDTQDVNEIHRTDREFFNRLHASRTAAKEHDAASQTQLAQQKQRADTERDQVIFDTSPKAWASIHEKKVQQMPERDLPAYVRQQATLIQQQQAALEHQVTTLKQEDQALSKTLEEMQGRNRALLRRDGHVPPETGTGAWHPEMMDEVEAVQEKVSRLQDRFLQYQEDHSRITRDVERRIAPLRQAQQRLGQAQEAHRTHSMQTIGLQGIAGASLTTQELEAQHQDQQRTLQKLQEEYPDGIPPEKIQAFQKDAAARQAESLQRLQQRMLAAHSAHQGIQSRLMEDPSLNAKAGELRLAAQANLATALHITPEQARVLLDDASLQDWGSYLHGETVPGMFGSDERETRMMSNGALIVHPRLHGDAQAYKNAVNRSSASPEAKRIALEMQPSVQRQWAAQMVDTLVAEQDIPGLPSFNQWREEKIRQDQNTRGTLGFIKLDLPDMAIRYMDEMKQRPAWQKYVDTFTRRLVTVGGHVGASVLSLASMVLQHTPQSRLTHQLTGIDISQTLAESAVSWTRSNNSISSSLGLKGGLDTIGLKATAILADGIPQIGSSLLGGSALKGLQLSKWLSTVAISGSQSAGQTFTSMYTQMRDQGISHEQAFKTTLPAALSAGAATAVLGVVMDKVGLTGMDHLGSSLKDPTVKKAITDLWKQQFKHLAGKTATATAGTAKEMVEETADSLFNEMIQALALNPNAKLDEIIGGVIRQTPEILTAVVEMSALTKGSSRGPGPSTASSPSAPPSLPAMGTPALPAITVPTPTPAPLVVPVPPPTPPGPAAEPQPRTSQNIIQPPPAIPPQAPIAAPAPSASHLGTVTSQPIAPAAVSQPSVPILEGQPPPGALVQAPAQNLRHAQPGPVSQGPTAQENPLTQLLALPSGKATLAPLTAQANTPQGHAGTAAPSVHDASLNNINHPSSQTTQGAAHANPPPPQNTDTSYQNQAQPALRPDTATVHTPPIWQGRARHGDYAEVLSRNPDGTFQVIIQGQEKTRTERDIAYMTGLKKPELYDMLGKATQQHLARPRPPAGTAPSPPSIWQGRARHGDYAEVLSRNPDGTFQVIIQGQEKTRTERDIAYMTGLKKPELYDMLGKATKGRLSGSFEAAPASESSLKSNDHAHESLTPQRPSLLDTLTQNLLANKNPPPANVRLPQNLNELRSMLQPMQAEARQLMNDSRKLEVEQRLIESDIGKSSISLQAKVNLEIRNNNIIKELEILVARRLELAAQTRLLVAIPPANRGQVNWRHKLVLDLGSQAAAAGDLTAQYVSSHLMPSLTVQQSSHGDANAKYDPVQQAIKITPGKTSLSDTMHEIVHGIEDQFPKILKKSTSFLMSRAEGEAPVPMAFVMDGFAKKPNAMGVRDKWWKRGGTHYSGRYYTAATGEIIATEILTTGIQRLHTSPIEFFTSDPEFFDFVITTLRFP
ncbi:hypothetical protein EI77_04652 [Prosthecobacter fusiformis]|uniref:Uncharacterized protein n=1 Tax=Prosthecobacter fusiformis TaxID=48464 RepID=A0A4R7RJD1_9BACT|nr:hypothetical protein [Prosthecobacter fusiformis]TDU62550.1 hypothetical protein EI77_04652 [Prosthecobacter fusiformis]